MSHANAAKKPLAGAVLCWFGSASMKQSEAHFTTAGRQPDDCRKTVRGTKAKPPATTALAALLCLSPARYPFSTYVDADGLISYGANQVDAYRRACIYVARILKGERPGDLPVELPTKFELAINLRTERSQWATSATRSRRCGDRISQGMSAIGTKRNLQTKNQCPLLGVKRTSLRRRRMSAIDPNRTPPSRRVMVSQLGRDIRRDYPMRRPLLTHQ